MSPGPSGPVDIESISSRCPVDVQSIPSNPTHQVIKVASKSVEETVFGKERISLA
ncbi:predicted protein [Histoplasma capsulatum var. duboisii H88]|uniref:Predicted protein n=1 Tax=Ajellomyces capsulatus (strain H88) TaxID=544711 RepID=F0UF65_AJEC8|nr:predicted protein [Histoplasma capsulatum var. duboisii H88]